MTTYFTGGLMWKSQNYGGLQSTKRWDTEEAAQRKAQDLEKRYNAGVSVGWHAKSGKYYLQTSYEGIQRMQGKGPTSMRPSHMR